MSARLAAAVVALFAGIAGCSSAGGGGGGGGGDGWTHSPDASTFVPGECEGTAAPGLGITKLVVGFTGSDAFARSPGLGLRYMYLSGGVPDGAGPCASCASGCSTDGASCSNSGGGCNWWGCWQWDQNPPGQYARNFLDRCEADGLIPMFTYYQHLHTTGVDEGEPQIRVAMVDATAMSRYLADFRFLLQQIGTRRAFLHIEPDLWGYAQHAAADPRTLPAAVGTANAQDCASQPNTVAGFGRCLVAMVRKYAPNARVGLHASAWASGIDVASSDDASVDPAAEGRATGAFLAAAGAGEADFVVADLADRDAAWSGRWLDATDATLPNFARIFAWSRAVADEVGRPIVWWQIPIGNMGLSNVPGAYRDNRLDYFFDHPDRVANSGAVVMAFGAGAGGQTDPETDNGHFAERAAELAAAGGQPLCAP